MTLAVYCVVTLTVCLVVTTVYLVVTTVHRVVTSTVYLVRHAALAQNRPRQLA